MTAEPPRGSTRPLRSMALALASILAMGILGTPVAGQDLPDRLTMERAVEIALGQSPQVRRSLATADNAAAGQRAAWGAFLPTARASLGLSRSSFTRTTFTDSVGVSRTLPEPLTSSSKSSSQGLNFNWNLLQGGRRFAELDAQGHDVRAAQRRLDDQRRTVAFQARTAYLTALSQQRLLELVEGQVEDRQLELDVAERRYQIAAVDRTDVLGAESNVLNAEIQLLNEQVAFEQALRELAVSMGLPPEAAEDVQLATVEQLPDVASLSVERLVADALASDPEIVALQAEADAAGARLWAARTNYLPTISLSYGLSRSQQLGPEDPFFFFDPSDTSNQFGVSVSWNLFDGFSREAEVASSSSARRQAEQDGVQRRLEIDREVRRLVDELRRLDRTLGLNERRLAISEERLDMTRTMYQTGNRDFTALQQAIDEVTTAERTVIELRFQLLQAWVELQQYGGGGV